MSINKEQFDIISQQTGNAFYLLDLKKFEENYSNFLTSFRTNYPSVNIAYSVKTNYIPQLCHQVKTMGGLVEIVSEMELDLALKIGFSGDKIIFNGPSKSKAALIKALHHNVIINVDSLHEFLLIDAIRSEVEIPHIKIGIRVNIFLNQTPVSRFGIDPDSNDFLQIIDMLSNNPRYEFACLHTHIMSPIRSVDAYSEASRVMCELFLKLSKKFTIKYLNMGGGFYSNMPEEYKKQFSFHIPSFSEYAESICKHVNNTLSTIKPVLLLEPGIAITADAMDVYAKILDIKNIRGKYFAYLNISKYDVKPTLHTKNLPIKIISCGSESTKFYHDLVMTGNTCMEDDILQTGFSGNLAIGDVVKFENAGAYTIVLKPNFIHPVLPVVLADKVDQFILIKSEEKMENVFSHYK